MGWVPPIRARIKVPISRWANWEGDQSNTQITDMDIMKEAEPSEFIKTVLPILQKNGVVHFLGFGNRLGFDSVSVHLQRLRCRCNFHAVKFVPEIQQVSSLLVQRLRKVSAMQTEMDKQLVGNNMLDPACSENDTAGAPNRYLALHMRFEEDMVAYSLCDFGGGEAERRELQAYREKHFPTVAMRLRNTSVSPEEQRSLGRCPLRVPDEVRNMVEEYKRVSARPRGRSVYRQPRTPGCMCRAGGDGSVDF